MNVTPNWKDPQRNKGFLGAVLLSSLFWYIPVFFLDAWCSRILVEIKSMLPKLDKGANICMTNTIIIFSLPKIRLSCFCVYQISMNPSPWTSHPAFLRSSPGWEAPTAPPSTTVHSSRSWMVWGCQRSRAMRCWRLGRDSDWVNLGWVGPMYLLLSISGHPMY